ncbi:hypothetical protein SK128_024129 [Halocaridina rubra]|uniref:Uncharacterized protein n=1 Tax=Halocaridina rubra TaxID=373956 RepID=A0AAN9AF00_HALRR
MYQSSFEKRTTPMEAQYWDYDTLQQFEIDLEKVDRVYDIYYLDDGVSGERFYLVARMVYNEELIYVELAASCDFTGFDCQGEGYVFLTLVNGMMSVIDYNLTIDELNNIREKYGTVYLNNKKKLEKFNIIGSRELKSVKKYGNVLYILKDDTVPNILIHSDVNVFNDIDDSQHEMPSHHHDNEGTMDYTATTATAATTAATAATAAAEEAAVATAPPNTQDIYNDLCSMIDLENSLSYLLSTTSIPNISHETLRICYYLSTMFFNKGNANNNNNNNNNGMVMAVVDSIKRALKYYTTRCAHFQILFDIDPFIEPLYACRSTEDIIEYITTVMMNAKIQNYLYKNTEYVATRNANHGATLGGSLCFENTKNFCASAIRTYLVCLRDYLKSTRFDPAYVFMIHFDTTLEGYLIPPLNMFNFIKIYKQFVASSSPSFSSSSYSSGYRNKWSDHNIFTLDELFHWECVIAYAAVRIISTVVEEEDVESIVKQPPETHNGLCLANVIYASHGKKIESPAMEHHSFTKIKDFVAKKTQFSTIKAFGEVLLSILNKIGFTLLRHKDVNGGITTYDKLCLETLFTFGDEKTNLILTVLNMFSDENIPYQYANQMISCLNVMRWANTEDDVARFISLLEDLYSYHNKPYGKVVNEINTKVEKPNRSFVHTHATLIL